MATKKTAVVENDTNDTATTNTQAKDIKAEKTFTLDALKKNCRALFGVPTVVFAGATAGLDTTKKYTVSKIKDTITKWCTKEVK